MLHLLNEIISTSYILFGILLYRDYSFPIIYLVHHLFISVGSNVYLFYAFGYNPVSCYLLCSSNCSNFGYWGPPSVGPSTMDIPYHFILLSTSLLFWSQQAILYITYPSHFSNQPGFFLLKNGIRNKDLSTNVFIVSGWCVFQHLQVTRAWKYTCVYSRFLSGFIKHFCIQNDICKQRQFHFFPT